MFFGFNQFYWSLACYESNEKLFSSSLVCAYSWSEQLLSIIDLRSNYCRRVDFSDSKRSGFLQFFTTQRGVLVLYRVLLLGEKRCFLHIFTTSKGALVVYRFHELESWLEIWLCCPTLTSVLKFYSCFWKTDFKSTLRTDGTCNLSNMPAIYLTYVLATYLTCPRPPPNVQSVIFYTCSNKMIVRLGMAKVVSSWAFINYVCRLKFFIIL